MATHADCLLAELDHMDKDMADIKNLDHDDLDTVSRLQKTQRYADIMQKLEDLQVARGPVFKYSRNQSIVQEEDPEYKLIVDCNHLSVDIENEIVIIHNFIRDRYRLKFPEMESLVHHPIDYARVVKRIGNETDLTLVDLEGLLPSATIMVVCLTASTTLGKPLLEEALRETVEACDRALELDSSKRKVLDFVEVRMSYIAPNLSEIVGCAVAAKLMGTAGGLSALANMPACNVQLLGSKRKSLDGFSSMKINPGMCYLDETEIFQSTPPALRTRACRLLAGKSTLAARVDSTRGDPTGKVGKAMIVEVRKKIDKWQEPPPAKQPKPLPIPISEPKKKRGGRRLRKMKEKYAMTEMRKEANRIQFGISEQSLLGDGFGEGYGMLGQTGSGRLRFSVALNKLSTKATKKLKAKHHGPINSTAFPSNSSLEEGIELSNPQAFVNQLGSGTQSTYFSEVGTFSKKFRRYNSNLCLPFRKLANM